VRISDIFTLCCFSEHSLCREILHCTSRRPIFSSSRCRRKTKIASQQQHGAIRGHQSLFEDVCHPFWAVGWSTGWAVPVHASRIKLVRFFFHQCRFVQRKDKYWLRYQPLSADLGRRNAILCDPTLGNSSWGKKAWTFPVPATRITTTTTTTGSVCLIYETKRKSPPLRQRFGVSLFITLAQS